ncbi:hypothetical protein [Vibrio sp. OPT18]|uniref:hypothetical protein n=1 Tax=Vibrio sp. OPT18 TaxID=2778641 RepID=UPI00187E2606|nr:hypothetical protein [Vibrio sp. OPT18]MBE8574117.1 hypothetical protein [Vibrio sp. OPT18]
MLTFVTDRTKNKPDILTPVKNRPLFLLSLEGQFLARYEAPNGGWTHQALSQMNTLFEPAWHYCGVDAFIGEQWVGGLAL